jgi:flavin-dependent dehydrogenase
MRFDAVVIGGGPAGSVTAMLLARRGVNVAVFDRAHPGEFCVGETLPPRATDVLERLGLLPAFQQQHHYPSHGIISVWGRDGSATTDFLANTQSNGWHLDRPAFNSMLLAAAEQSGARVYRDYAIKECTEDDRGWQIDRSFHARVIVDAGGRRPNDLGFPRRMVLDRLIAAAGLAPSRGEVSPYTLVEAIDEGWFYSAMLPRGEYIVAYLTDGDLYAAGSSRSPEFFREQLAKAAQTSARLAAAPAEPAVVTAVTSVRDPAVRRNWIAVGDAARSYDPLSGLGLWNALDMATKAAPVILDMLKGHTAFAEEYERTNRLVFAQYRETQRSYYRLEQRWPESEFWRRRHGGSHRSS